MTKEAEDRGDELVLETDGDKSGDTDGQKAEAAAKVAKEAADKTAADAVAAEAKVKADAEAAAAAAKTDGEKEHMIPKSRFDQAVQKARKEAEGAQKALAEAEAQLKASRGEIDAEKIETELAQLDVKLDQAVADNDKTAIAALRADIRARERALGDARAKAHAVYATAVAVEQIRYDGLVSRMEIEHPELNPEAEKTYDQEKVDEVMELKEAFEAKGLGSTEALQKALKAVYRGGPTPEKDPAAEKAKADAKAKAEAEAARLKAEAVAKGLVTKDNQPAATGKVGADSDKGGKTGKDGDVMKMSEKEFDKLTEDEKRKMRGDDM
jgi:hypothetical protein